MLSLLAGGEASPLTSGIQVPVSAKEGAALSTCPWGGRAAGDQDPLASPPSWDTPAAAYKGPLVRCH